MNNLLTMVTDQLDRKKVFVFDLDGTLVDTDGQLKGKGMRPLDCITPFTGVPEVLQIAGSINILVTAGNSDLQNKKVDALKLRQYFQQINVVEHKEEKQEVFRCIAEKFQGSEALIAVIGDRLDYEIRYGNECGFITFHINQGSHNGKKRPNTFGTSDGAQFTVSTCEELIPLLTNLKP